MILGDPERNFEVTVNDGITEAELFIINRQGTLVHYQKTEQTPIGSPFFEWDGTSNGNYIMPGTYVIILIGRNPEYNFEEKITGSLLVIE
jgi:flagellar hook assembly protein FlgD